MPDVETQHRIIREDVRGGILSINEGRMILNYDLYSGKPSTVGDALWAQANLIPAMDKYLELYFANAQRTLTEPQPTEAPPQK
jgi:hypothetical protein